MRSRNNNNNNNSNRRGQNPLTRVYESNGPDVKVRGTAQHIAEKYLQLARDAQASSDPVAAENYLQHAEHYYRIIAAAQAQFGTPGQPFQRLEEDDEDFDGDEGQGFDAPQPYAREPQQGQRENQRDYGREGGDRQPRDFQQRDYAPRDQQQPPRDYAPRDQQQPQREPYRDANGQSRRDRDRNNNTRDNNADRQPREFREPREGGERQQREFREPREGGERQPREGGERAPRENRWQREQRPPRENREAAAETPYRDPAQQPQPSLGPDVEVEIGLPSFITQGGAAPLAAPPPAIEAPVAAPAPVAPPAAVVAPVAEPVAVAAPAAAEAVPAPAPEAEGEGEAKPRPRRRRYRRAGSAEEGTEAGDTPAAPVEAGE